MCESGTGETTPSTSQNAGVLVASSAGSSFADESVVCGKAALASWAQASVPGLARAGAATINPSAVRASGPVELPFRFMGFPRGDAATAARPADMEPERAARATAAEYIDGRRQAAGIDAATSTSQTASGASTRS